MDSGTANYIDDRFPPERKNEFLNWVMLTQPKVRWASIVFAYIRQHQLKNWYEGLNFVAKWFISPSYAAWRLVHLKLAEPEWARTIIQTDHLEHDTSDIAIKPYQMAWRMVNQGHATQEWYDEHFGNKQ